MSTWYMITTVPVGTCAWLAEVGAFREPSMYERGEAYERFEPSQERASDWVGGATSTSKLYEVLSGKPTRHHELWKQTSPPDPFRLALVGGDLMIPYITYHGYTEKLYRFSTTEEAAEAQRVMEGIAARLEQGEEALQPFGSDIHAYLDFYRSVKPGEEELCYSHT